MHVVLNRQVISVCNVAVCEDIQIQHRCLTFLQVAFNVISWTFQKDNSDKALKKHITMVLSSDHINTMCSKEMQGSQEYSEFP